MDAIAVKNIFWTTKSKIPKTSWNISGYSRSAFRTGFYIKELDIMLDAGPQCFSKPSHIFVTHTHIDHVANLPLTLLGDVNDEHVYQIYTPKTAEKYVNNYINAMFNLTLMEKFDAEELKDCYKIKELSKGDNICIRTNNVDISIETFECVHEIPTISYGFSEIKNKLKEKYMGLDGKTIKKMREDGIEITDKVLQKRFAYVCDTSINVFEMNPTILDYDVIFIECTFLLDDEIPNAIKTKHIHWTQLKPFVERYPDKIFTLFHFSQRYSDDEIAEFFKSETELKNIKLWIN